MLVEPVNFEYTCGFMMNRSLGLVALVRKQKPLWQAGLLNGIGGSLERLCKCGHIEAAHGAESGVQLRKCVECYALRNILKQQCAGFEFVHWETPEQCMKREFKEETGVVTSARDWHNFCTMQGWCLRQQQDETKQWRCHFFSAFAPVADIMKVRSTGAEAILIESIANVGPHNAISNLSWLMRLALDIGSDVAKRLDIVESY